MTFLEEFAAFKAANGTPDRIELLLCDINAVIRGKWLPGTDAAKLEKGQVRLPISTYAPTILGEELPETGLGITAGDPDGIIYPVLGTLMPVPWVEGNVAQVLVEMRAPKGTYEGLSTRKHLADMVKRYTDRGMQPVIATELEFYIVQKRNTPFDPPVPPEFAPLAQNYELNVLDRTAPILDEIMSASVIQGLATDSLIAEYGPGQYEINFHHTDDVLGAADTAILFRRLVRGVTRKHGMEATFMAKPYAAHPGNGMHVHVSVMQGDDNIFSAEDGIAPTLQNAVAGVLSTMGDVQAVLAPHMNSFRRFSPGSFSPNRPDWGLDNRNAAVRLPETRGPGARLEHRIAGADVNPYLAVTAILGGVLHGMDTQPVLPLPLDDPEAEPADPLAHDWSLAVDCFTDSAFTTDIFDARFCEIFEMLKRDEINKLTTSITNIEYQTYLGRL
jgi:glutamine synthetase